MYTRARTHTHIYMSLLPAAFWQRAFLGWIEILIFLACTHTPRNSLVMVPRRSQTQALRP